jgi:hypothetical protein
MPCPIAQWIKKSQCFGPLLFTWAGKSEDSVEKAVENVDHGMVPRRPS